MIASSLLVALGLSLAGHGTLLDGTDPSGSLTQAGPVAVERSVNAKPRAPSAPLGTGAGLLLPEPGSVVPVGAAAYAPALPGPALRLAAVGVRTPSEAVVPDAPPTTVAALTAVAVGGHFALPVVEELAQVALPAAPAAEAPDIDGWPAHGEIVFRVLLGSGGLQVGEARHDWSHDGKQYRMQVTLETTGVAALLRDFRYVQRSEGTLGPQGLRPNTFAVNQQGREPETASFDWGAERVRIRRGERERRVAEIEPGAQDVLSLWHQIGIVGTAGLPRNLTVVSNKDANAARLEVVGEEALSLPIGRVDALRVRAKAKSGKLTIDIWLARKHGMLPVRILMVDNKGEVLDQQAIHLRLAPRGEDAARPVEKTDIIDLNEDLPALPRAELHIY